MRNLFTFIFRYRGILVFGLLEVLSLYLLIRNSSYQRAAFFNSANAYAGRVLEMRTQVLDYFRLVDVNRGLVAENAALRQQLYRPDLAGRLPDSLAPAEPLRPARRDSILLGLRQLLATDPDYPLIPARVISNTRRRIDNYLTINAGTRDGVRPGMGLLSADGVVGRVKVASEHYATATSVLHSKTVISAKIKRDGTEGGIKWLGDDAAHVLLDQIPRQNELVRGDTILTSGYNAVFPEGVMIGTIDAFSKEPDKDFWTIRVRLAVDFSRLTYVYVVNSRSKAERDTLQVRAGAKPEEEEEIQKP